MYLKEYSTFFVEFIKSFPGALTPKQILEGQVLRKRLSSIFYQLTEESYQGRLGEKREPNLCAMPPPMVVQLSRGRRKFTVPWATNRADYIRQRAITYHKHSAMCIFLQGSFILS